MLLLFPFYSVNKPREFLSAEGFLLIQHKILLTDKQGNVRELEGRIPDEIINLKGKDDAVL